MRQWLTPFVWTEDGGKTVHLCADRVCRELGWPCTEENLGLAVCALREFAERIRAGSVKLDAVADELAVKATLKGGLP